MHEGDLTIDVDGTVVDGLEVRGTVWVRAEDVVIRNSLISGRTYTSDLALVMVRDPAHSVTIEDSELAATHPSPHIRGVVGQNFTLRRVDVHDVVDQMVITGDDVLVEESWLHDNLYYLEDANYGGKPTHDDNAQISIGDDIRFLRNTMEGTHNASIMVTQDRGPVSDLHVVGNWVSDGACAFNFAEKAYGPMRGFVVADNVFTRTQKHAGCALVTDPGTIGLLRLTNNTWADGAPITVTRRS